MSLSEDQLRTWTNSPSSVKPQFTHQQIRKAIEQAEHLKGKDIEVYLQGSYANSTNIKLDSDVDVVVQLNSVWNRDISAMPRDQQIAYLASVHISDYDVTQFRLDVFKALSDYFGSAYVRPGNKSIKLLGNGSRVNADILPCLEYRNYEYFHTSANQKYIQGIRFLTQDAGKEIINYPKLHISNGEDKNGEHRTDVMYKHLVRIFKNAKRQLVEKYGFDPKIAPSYFIECSIYNVPDNHFSSNYRATVNDVLEFILRRCTPAQMTTVSHQHLLFGPEPWQWNKEHAGAFFGAVERL